MIKIVCDSISDLPIEIIQKYDIEIVPLTVLFNGVEYLAGKDLTNEQFYKMLRETSSMPKTSQATYAQFKSTFEKYNDSNYEILYIAGSSAASGTYQSAVLAKNDGHDNVTIIDTQSLSIGSGLFVMKACELVEQGFTLNEIIDILENLKDSEDVVFSVDNLEYLKMGGRISSAKATLGNLLSIKPILEVKDGLVTQKSQVRGKKQIFTTLVNSIISKYGNDLTNKTIILGCGDNEEDLNTLKDTLLKDAKIDKIYSVNIGCVVCSHSGPGIVGISCL